MLANALRKALPDDTSITVVDRDDVHHCQPGYLFVPFGAYTPERVVRSRRAQLAGGGRFLQQGVSRVDPQRHVVLLDGGDELAYDWLVIASGTTPQPAQTPGLLDDKVWRTSAFDFYTLDGAAALHDALANFEGGRLLVHITDLPIKCPVAPLEFAFLADDYFRKRRIRCCACSRTAASGSRQTSRSRTSTPTRRPSSRMTGVPSPSTCWSPCR